jgi:hypothetical protein
MPTREAVFLQDASRDGDVLPMNFSHVQASWLGGAAALSLFVVSASASSPHERTRYAGPLRRTRMIASALLHDTCRLEPGVRQCAGLSPRR